MFVIIFFCRAFANEVLFQLTFKMNFSLSGAIKSYIKKLHKSIHVFTHFPIAKLSKVVKKSRLLNVIHNMSTKICFTCRFIQCYESTTKKNWEPLL